MTLPQFVSADRERAARHEAGHWLTYAYFGFRPGAITVDAERLTYSAEIQGESPPAEDPEEVRIAFLKNRMRTVLGGLFGQVVLRADGREHSFLTPTAWRPYREFKHDYDRFSQLAIELATLEGLGADKASSAGGDTLAQHYFAELRGEVEECLANAAGALDAIQDLIESSEPRTFEASEIEALPAVSRFLGALKGQVP